jgi:hypothetical protein
LASCGRAEELAPEAILETKEKVMIGYWNICVSYDIPPEESRELEEQTYII